MKESVFRGHKIKLINESYVFSDTGLQTSETWKERGCGFCKKQDTPEGHDACLGTLPDTMNACCGHGNDDIAYVQLWDGSTVQGKEAVNLIEELKSKK